MIVPEDRVLAIAEAGHKIFYDLAYLGATGPNVFDLSHPNIVAAVVSFSKPYGLFYYRVGFTFCRDPIPALYANKWFKNVYGLLIAERILDHLDRAGLVRKYKAIQATIVGQINQAFGMGLLASDAFLLAKLPADAGARLPAEERQMIERFRRGDWYRFCLTPYFLECERR
jgi:histidinol-phosphate/aromatic aminotransferase/cobyric acid decarboxylase-like protein